MVTTLLSVGFYKRQRGWAGKTIKRRRRFSKRRRRFNKRRRRFNKRRRRFNSVPYLRQGEMRASPSFERFKPFSAETQSFYSPEFFRLKSRRGRRGWPRAPVHCCGVKRVK